MKKLCLFIFLLLCSFSWGQDYIYSANFIVARTDTASQNFANTGITSFQLSWRPETVIFGCAVQLDSSADGVSWGNGDLIPSQNCGTAGSSPLGMLANGKTFVRIRVTSLTGNAGVSVTVKGWGGSVGLPNTLLASGSSPCARALSIMANFPGRTITAQNDVTGSVQHCGTDQLDNANGNSAWYPITLLLPGGMVWDTDYGFNLGDREDIIGDGEGNITSTVTTQSGTNLVTSSLFPACNPSSGGITVNTQPALNALTLAVAWSGGTSSNGVPCATLLIEPGTHFKVNGDTTDYVLIPCGHNNSSCASSQGTAQASQYYAITSGGTATFKLTTTNLTLTGMQTQPTVGTSVFLQTPIVTFGDWNTQKNGSGSSQQQLVKKLSVVNTATGGASCFAVPVEPQEDSTLDNVACGNAAHAFLFYNAIHSGPHYALRATWSSTACTAYSGFLSAAEIAVAQTEIHGFAAFASASTCTPAAFPFGLFHLTNSPLGGGNGGAILTDFHGELNGSSSTGDIFYIDATTGNWQIINPQGCSAVTCKNIVHWVSTARGTLDLEISVGCTSTTNFIQDDWNGNTIPCSSYTTGTGYYKIYQDGTVETNLCAGLVKGICRSPSGNTTQKTETGTADANVLTLTPPAQAGTYNIRYVVDVSAATAAVVGGTISYKDANGSTVTNQPFSLYQLNTAAPALTFTTSAASNYSGVFQINTDNSATAIVLKWVGGGTCTTCKVTASIERTN